MAVPRCQAEFLVVRESAKSYYKLVVARGAVGGDRRRACALFRRPHSRLLPFSGATSGGATSIVAGVKSQSMDPVVGRPRWHGRGRPIQELPDWAKDTSDEADAKPASSTTRVRTFLSR